jgi:hypothetical protein
MGKPTTLKPGQFWATCNLTKPHPVRQMAEYQRREAEERGWKKGFREARVKRELRNTECYLEPLCEGFETTDKAAFEAHMRDVHGKSEVRGENSALVARATGRWRTPKAKPEGTPYTPTKAFVGEVVTCPGCGLVMENGSTYADELFVREHLDLCVGLQDGAA